MIPTQTKIQDLLPQLSFLETASLIHAATEAIRHSCGICRCYADLGIRVDLLHDDTEEDSDWMHPDILDIRDTKELVNLISEASCWLQKLSK